jgi:hypothetical protein
MSRSEYVVTRNGSASNTPSLFDFSAGVGKLHKLEVDKNGHVFYVPIADGKIGELAKLAEELNAVNEPIAETAQAEPARWERGETVGNPTEPEESPAEWTVRQVALLLELADSGKMNLVDFKNRVSEFIKEKQ